MVCKIFYFYIQRNSLIAIKSFNQIHQSRECVLAKAPERNATHFHSVSCAEWAQIHSCMCETPYHFCCHHSSQCTGCLRPYSTVSSFCWDVSCLYSDDLKCPAVLPFLSSQWWKTIKSRVSLSHFSKKDVFEPSLQEWRQQSQMTLKVSQNA